jgi:aspartyl-tRNA(Asn)/glutamyl-tRNA(Gln) amidotransferase subunit A
MSNRYHYMTIGELGELIRNQTVSSVDVVAECLERIQMVQSKINAFITILADQAMAEAKQATAEIKAGKWRGPLHGIPVAVKDMYDTAGIKTTAAFEQFADRIPQKDAAAVTRLKEAGAIIIGKTNMHKLAMGTTTLDSAFGPVKNPWNKEFIAGGSSGGSAAAVAAGLCFATIDTDAVGSCRLPAACCGVVGYKCTSGLIDNSGILADQPADPVILKLATAAITTRDAGDTVLLTTVLTDSTMNTDTAIKRLGVVQNFGADPAVRKNFLQATEVFKNQGYELVEVSAPFDENPDMQQIDAARGMVADMFTDIDVMILPTLATTVPRAADLDPDPQALSPQNTFFANYFGLPAVSVPSGFDGHGLPFGLQIVGNQDHDAAVLQLAQDYQRATPWGGQHPKAAF